MRYLPNERPERPDLTPLIDATFLLLVFFLCTLSWRTLEGKLAAYLPDDVGLGRNPAEPLERIRIRVDAEPEGVRYAVGPRRLATIGEVRARLAELHDQAPDRGITIDARTGTTHGDVVLVVDACALTGATDIAFAAQPDAR